MREVRAHGAIATIRRHLAALSSLFKHLGCHGHASRNPVTEVERPAINRDEGTTLAFWNQDARKLLDLQTLGLVEGLCGRAILSVGLQLGMRRAEIAALKVGDLHQNRGYASLRVHARAAVGTRWRSTRRRRRGCAPIWSPRDTRPTSTGPCSDP
jgi:integrase/recombinase XerD